MPFSHELAGRLDQLRRREGLREKWSGEWSVPRIHRSGGDEEDARGGMPFEQRGEMGRRRAAPGPQPFSLVVLARVISRGENPGGDVATDIAVEVVQITALSEWDDVDWSPVQITL